ncbi:MAG TPA: FAD-dependent monooxygenase [Streptosporangiaceae bacterium]|jgi:2-polyprenyl-6-methoxyphenol hydroxylase-like FAD-dependent oxidoreductase
METQVLIAGAGPTGLVLAIELARRGVPCQVVDAAAGICPGSRGKGLQPRTLEVFDDLGVLDAVRASGGDYPAVRAYAGREVVWEGRMSDVTAATPDVPYPNIWMIPQWRTEEILRARLAGLGVQVRQGAELTGCDAGPEGVTATLATASGEERVRAAYLVGADGGRSAVRALMGIGFAGETREAERMLFGDLRIDGLDHDYWHTWSPSPDRSDMLALCPLPGTDAFQLAAADPGDPFTPGHALLQELLTARTGRDDIRLREIVWLSRWRANMRMAERFRAGRVLLAGDAAHVHSPAGGQGLNTSVQDAYNLGWKLAAVIAGADPWLLGTYESERLPVAAHVLGISTDLHGQASTTGIGPAKRGPETQQLDIGYAGGPLAPIHPHPPTQPATDPTAATDPATTTGAATATPEPAADAPRPGDRAPDAPGLRRADGSAARLFDLFRGPHHTLLAFGPTAAQAAADLARPYGDAVHPHLILTPGTPAPPPQIPTATDTDGHAAKTYNIDTDTLILIRPDGYIGAITHPDTAPDLATYLHRVAAPC